MLMLYWQGTNSGLDFWNGTLDWTTGMTFLTVLSILVHFTKVYYICLFIASPIYFTYTWILTCTHGVDLATIVINHRYIMPTCNSQIIIIGAIFIHTHIIACSTSVSQHLICNLNQSVCSEFHFPLLFVFGIKHVPLYMHTIYMYMVLCVRPTGISKAINRHNKPDLYKVHENA